MAFSTVLIMTTKIWVAAVRLCLNNPGRIHECYMYVYVQHGACSICTEYTNIQYYKGIPLINGVNSSFALAR